jgi:hypothetical protein
MIGLARQHLIERPDRLRQVTLRGVDLGERSARAASGMCKPFSTTRASRSRARPSHPRARARSFGLAVRVTISSTSSGCVSTRGRCTPSFSATATSSSRESFSICCRSMP